MNAVTIASFVAMVPVGAALAWWMTAAPPHAPQTAPAAETAAAAPTRCPPASGAPPRNTAALTLAVNAAKARIASLETARVELAGAPHAWEPDLPAHARPEAIEAMVHAAAETAGMEVLAVECEEMPCLIAVSGRVPMDEHFNDVTRRYSDEFRAAMGPLNVLSTGDAGRPQGEDTWETLIVGAVWHEPQPAELLTDTRTTFRRQALEMVLDQEYAEARVERERAERAGAAP